MHTADLATLRRQACEAGIALRRADDAYYRSKSGTEEAFALLRTHHDALDAKARADTELQIAVDREAICQRATMDACIAQQRELQEWCARQVTAEQSRAPTPSTQPASTDATT